MTSIDRSLVDAALARVEDPEIHRPITDLGMVKSVDIEGDVTASPALTDGRRNGAMGDAAGDFLGIDMGL